MRESHLPVGLSKKSLQVGGGGGAPNAPGLIIGTFIIDKDARCGDVALCLCGVYLPTYKHTELRPGPMKTNSKNFVRRINQTSNAHVSSPKRRNMHMRPQPPFPSCSCGLGSLATVATAERSGAYLFAWAVRANAPSLLRKDLHSRGRESPTKYPLSRW